MFSLNGPELVFIFGLALLVFGPKKLPEIGRTIGQGLRELRRASRELTDAFDVSDVTSNLPKVSDFLSDDTFEPARKADEPDRVADLEPDEEPDRLDDSELDSQKGEL